MHPKNAEAALDDILRVAEAHDVQIEEMVAPSAIVDAVFVGFPPGNTFSYRGVVVRRGQMPLKVRVLAALRGSGFEDLANEFERKIK